MRHLVSPMPEMICQTFGLGIMFNLPLIDPTCGRYCLKALLKHHIERLWGVRLADVTLPRPSSTLANWIAYDPATDFPFAQEMLVELEGPRMPQTAPAWIGLLQNVGPVILGGKLGRATVEHAILLVGADDANGGVLLFKDPLAGDAIGEEAFATMQPRINRAIYAPPSVGGPLRRRAHALGLRDLAETPFRT